MQLFRGDWFYLVLVFIDAFFMTRPYLYAIQQDNYLISEIFKNRRLRFIYLIDLCAVALFIGIWCIFYFLQTRAFWGFITVLFFFIAEFAMYFMEDLPTRKKPLKYTKRAVRFLIFMSIFCTATVSICFAIGNAHIPNQYMRYLVLFVFPPLYPLMFIVFGSLINFFEKLNNRRYIRSASKTLMQNKNLIKVAITGSYGKTSVKNFLTRMLEEKYSVLCTPASYNTPLGIAKTVRRLDATYDIFVAEFGARRVGDIRELMNMVKPKYTILTAINSQHLKTFKKQENIVREKCRIIDVGQAGECVVNGNLYSHAEDAATKLKYRPKIIYAGRNGDGFRAENIKITKDGSRFTLFLDGKPFIADTPLIGFGNVENIVLAAAMAYSLGVDGESIVRAISNLEPVPHRLQLIHGNGIDIIDDSFNSNPDGAKSAVETLQMFEGRKVVMTPGLVELGKSENDENYKLGEEIGKVADLVLLIGSARAEMIKRGLIDSGYSGEIHVYNKLSACEDDFKNRLHAGDVLLILNDLPDIYDEKK